MSLSRMAFFVLPLALAILAFPVAAAEGDSQQNNRSAPQPGDQAQPRSEAKELVENAAKVVEKMKSDERLVALMKKSQGVFIVPDLVKGAFIAGGYGGEGVLLGYAHGKWSNPAFFNVGAATIGAQAGAAAGPMVMILMNDDALNAFKNGNSFSLDARAGFSIIDYAAVVEEGAGKGDLVVWSDEAGAFAGASVGVSDINVDEDLNHAYYGTGVGTAAILNGKVRNPDAKPLRIKMPG